jgi:hypothetical protein
VTESLLNARACGHFSLVTVGFLISIPLGECGDYYLNNTFMILIYTTLKDLE